MAELLVKISYIAFAGAVVCLILAVILFIKFKIPTVIGDLSGKMRRKQFSRCGRQTPKKAIRPLNQEKRTKSIKN